MSTHTDERPNARAGAQRMGFVRRPRFEDYREKYAKRGWTMFDSIDRVYDAGKAKRKLGFVCKTGFREVLDSL